MILLLANYLNNIEYFSADKTSETPEVTLNDNDTASRIIWLYVIICLCAAALSFILNCRDNQPTSVCLLCALYAWGVVFFIIFL